MCGDLCVGFDVGKNALADDRVFFHLAPLLQRQWSVLLEDSRRDADLPDVVEQTREVSKPLLIGRKPQSLGDISRVDGNRGRVTGRVSVSRIERRDKRTRERQVRSLELLVDHTKVSRETSLLLIHDPKPLGSKGREEEEEQRPGRELHVRVREGSRRAPV